ncbi:hypothetical protein [Nesterenkonia sp. NBAIMH1]|uniref:hypothetical protein n=1 Tax=Nesterenkonia sp. NBAIMH1 TaxID=2600320 RepID=UPI001FF011F8|nr:hypothetical protein [Nesterenkonia sp. NBAIMH1]
MRHHGSSEWWPFVLALRTRMSFYFPEPGMIGYATSQLWSHKESPPTSRFMQVHMHCQTAVAALAAGGLPQAARHLERAKELDYPRRPGPASNTRRRCSTPGAASGSMFD